MGVTNHACPSFSLSCSFPVHSTPFNFSVLILNNAVIVIVLFLAVSQQPTERHQLGFCMGEMGREDQDSEARFQGPRMRALCYRLQSEKKTRDLHACLPSMPIHESREAPPILQFHATLAINQSISRIVKNQPPQNIVTPPPSIIFLRPFYIHDSMPQFLLSDTMLWKRKGKMLGVAGGERLLILNIVELLS
jgi:hypothetical protein